MSFQAISRSDFWRIAAVKSHSWRKSTPSERRIACTRLLARLKALKDPVPWPVLGKLLVVDGSADLLRFARASNANPDDLANAPQARVMGHYPHRYFSSPSHPSAAPVGCR